MAHTMTRAQFDSLRTQLEATDTAGLETLLANVSTVTTDPEKVKMLALLASNHVGGNILVENMQAVTNFMHYNIPGILAARKYKQ